MNRFDTFTTWTSSTSSGSDSDSQTEDQSFDSNSTDDDATVGSHYTSGETQSHGHSDSNQCGTNGPNDNGPHDSDSNQGDGLSPSSWTAAVRAQTFFVPLHYEANYQYPLIVWLHSDGFNENQVCHVMPHVSARNYLATGVRAPMAADSSGHRFAWSQSSASLASAERTVLEAIDQTARKYSVHHQRIVLAGYQNGGTMATRIALQHPELFAAAISLGGDFDLPESNTIDPERLRQRRMPMLWQRSLLSPHFDEDKLAIEISEAHSTGSQIEIRQYRNDDEMNTVVLRDLDRWIMQHVVSGAPVAKMNLWDSSPTSFSDN